MFTEVASTKVIDFYLFDIQIIFSAFAFCSGEDVKVFRQYHDVLYFSAAFADKMSMRHHIGIEVQFFVQFKLLATPSLAKSFNVL